MASQASSTPGRPYPPPPASESALPALAGVVDVKVQNNTIRVYADKAEGLLANAMRVAGERGAIVTDAHVSEPSLENLFLHLTGRSLRD